MSEKFCLKWNDFYSNASKSFGIFRNEEYLHDVTLVSDDHNKVSAHRLVLSASSEYFKDIFKNNKHSHPLLCLNGISMEDLNNIMDYIYNGEVQIHQEQLNRFLDVAQRLKLEGLIGNSTEEDLDDKTSHDNIFNTEKIEPTLFDDGSYEVSQTEKTVRKNNAQNLVGTIAVANDDIDGQINQYIEVCSDGSYKCTVCGKTSARKQDTQRHIETHIEGLSYECPTCHKTFRSKHNLANHKSYKSHK